MRAKPQAKASKFTKIHCNFINLGNEIQDNNKTFESTKIYVKIFENNTIFYFANYSFKVN
jgi:hypothetical protein